MEGEKNKALRKTDKTAKTGRVGCFELEGFMRSYIVVIGTIIFNGNLPKESSFTIIAGRVFFISAPIVGSKFINHISLCFIKIGIVKVSKGCQLIICFIIY